MVFWWVPYLAKRPRPDFNNGSGDNSNCGYNLGPRHLFEFDLNNYLSPGNSSLGSDGGSTFVHLNLWSPKILIIHLMSAISGPKSLIIAHGIIWIIAAFWPTGVYLCPTQIMTPPQVFAILVKWKIHLFRCPTYGLMVGAISGQVPQAWLQ